MKTARQAIALLALCAAWMWITSDAARAQGQAGTTLTASKTAQGYFNRIETYDWTVAKAVDKAGLTIKEGESDTVEFTIQATRTGPAISDVFGVRGQACVTNGGERPTQNLALFDHVQFKNWARTKRLPAFSPPGPATAFPTTSSLFPYPERPTETPST